MNEYGTEKPTFPKLWVFRENQIKTLNPKCWEWDGVGVGEIERVFWTACTGKRQPTELKNPLHQSNHYGHHKQMVINPKKITCISAF